MIDDLSYGDYRRIVTELATEAAKHHLETGGELVECIDAAMFSTDEAKATLRYCPTRVIEYAETVDHWEQLTDETSDPEEILRAMAHRGIEEDTWRVADAIISIARWLGHVPGEAHAAEVEN